MHAVQLLYQHNAKSAPTTVSHIGAITEILKLKSNACDHSGKVVYGYGLFQKLFIKIFKKYAGRHGITMCKRARIPK